jgi:hypothetical protein
MHEPNKQILGQLPIEAFTMMKGYHSIKKENMDLR